MTNATYRYSTAMYDVVTVGATIANGVKPKFGDGSFHVTAYLARGEGDTLDGQTIELVLAPAKRIGKDGELLPERKGPKPAPTADDIVKSVAKSIPKGATPEGILEALDAMMARLAA